MTKTLTEQWREGTLDGGIYYLLLRDGTTVTDQTIYIVGEKQFRWHFSSFDFVKEVLAPVPSYDEFVQQRDFVKDHQKVLIENMNLKRKLEIATKALKKYAESDNWFEEDIHGEVWSFQKESKYPWRIGFKALKEMEGVK